MTVYGALGGAGSGARDEQAEKKEVRKIIAKYWRMKRPTEPKKKRRKQ